MAYPVVNEGTPIFYVLKSALAVRQGVVEGTFGLSSSMRYRVRFPNTVMPTNIFPATMEKNGFFWTYKEALQALELLLNARLERALGLVRRYKALHETAFQELNQPLHFHLSKIISKINETLPDKVLIDVQYKEGNCFITLSDRHPNYIVVLHFTWDGSRIQYQMTGDVPDELSFVQKLVDDYLANTNF